jgi:outer membrane protein assembly factor BamB
MGCLVLGAALIAPAEAASAVQKPGDATNYQVNAVHTGVATGPALSNKMHRLWFKDFGARTSYPLIVGNRVFVAARPKTGPGKSLRVFAFDKRTGRQLWKSSSLGHGTATLAYGNGKLVALADNFAGNGEPTTVRALSPATGKTAWNKKLAAPKYTTIVHNAEYPVTVREGVAYVNFAYSGDNYMAIDVATGKTRWALYGTNDFSLGQAVSSNRVYFAGSCTRAARTLNGKQIWRADRGCWGDAGSTYASVLDGQRLWVPSDFRGSRVIDARNGKELFQFDSTQTPAVVGRKAFLVPWTGSGYAVELRAVNSSTGAGLWSRNQPQYGQIVSPPIATAKVVYVTTGDGWSLGYSTSTGALVWSAKGGGYLDTQIERLTNPGQAIGGGVLATTATNRLVVFG